MSLSMRFRNSEDFRERKRPIAAECPRFSFVRFIQSETLVYHRPNDCPGPSNMLFVRSNKLPAFAAVIRQQTLGSRPCWSRERKVASVLVSRAFASKASAWETLIQTETKYDERTRSKMLLVGAFVGAALTGGSAIAMCEKKKKNVPSEKFDLTPASVAKEDFEAVQASHNIDEMPIYTIGDLAAHDGSDGSRIWVSYGGVIYDVTDWMSNHPGGAEHLMKAAGGPLEPWWYYYRQHYASDLPMRVMEHLAVGRLNEKDQDDIDEQMSVMEEEDPYAREPMRHKSLIVHSDTPMNAETPCRNLTENFLTPTSLFYIRHHHPVPYLDQKQLTDFRLKVDLSALGKGVHSFTLDELKAMKKTEVVATLQCSGNRRSGFNTYQRTSGTPWGQGALSTGKFVGVRLTDLLKEAGLEDAIDVQQKGGMEHVRMYSLDGMMASIGIEKAMSPYGDVIVCYEMNDEPLPRDHGFPLRMIVPGYAAVRNVKWLNKIELSKEEAEGPWQRGLNYKTLPPGITDANNVDLAKMPSITELSLYSGITHVERTNNEGLNPGDRVIMKASGWALAGGGRNIVRVDVTGDDGKTWSSAELKEGSDQKYGKAWAWTFWECEVPAVVGEDGNVRLASKAVDMAFNSQPEHASHMWNVRGLGNNSWYRVQVRVVETKSSPSKL